MTQTSDPAVLQRMIQTSNILTDSEREYWTMSLPKMTPEQLSKLAGILTRAQQIPWTEQIQNYFLLIAKSAKTIRGRAA